MTGKVLVTGANGFVGINLCRKLIERGYKVKAFVMDDVNWDILDKMQVEFAPGNLMHQISIVEGLKDVDYVINVAGKASDWGTYDSFVIPNIKGVENMISYSMQANIKKFVHISSVAIHGFGNHVNTTEDGPFYKTNFPYCLTKKKGEEIALAAYREHSFPVTAIRPCNVFGENDTTTISKMAPALENRQLPYVDGGKWLTCPVYVGNLSDAIIAAMENDAAVGEAFIISDGLWITWKEWTKKLCDALNVKEHWFSAPGFIARALGSTFEFIYKFFDSPTPPPFTRYRTQQVSTNYHFSIEKAKRLLGWKPEVDIDTAVERSISWYLDFKRKVN